MIMTTNRRITATALVLSIHMVLQCSGKTTSPSSQKLKNEQNSSNHSVETTTIFPVNPYVFSVEDYDTLQDAESLQQALSIVAYEPQKLDVKKADSKVKKNDRTFDPTQLSRTTTLPPEKKYYEVPRKQLNTRSSGKFERKADDADTTKIAEEASSLRQAYEVTPVNPQILEAYQRHHQQRPVSSVSPSPSSRSFSRNNQEVVASPSPPLPLYPPLTERTPAANVARSRDNYQVVSRSRDNKVTEQRSSEAIKTVITTTPTVRKKRRWPQRNQSTQEPEKPYQVPEVQLQHRQQASLLVANDRIPRPFAFPADVNPTAQASVHSARIAPLRQNLVRPSAASMEQTLAYPTVSARHSLPRPTSSVEQSEDYSTTPFRQNSRTFAPIRQEPLVYPIAPRNQQFASRVAVSSESQEQPITYRPIPVRRNHNIRHYTSTEQDEVQSTVPAEQAVARSTTPTRQEQQIVYTIPRRPEQVSVRPTVASTQEQTTAHTRFSSRRRQSIRTTAPTRQEQLQTYSTVPSRQEQVSTYSTTPAKQELALPYSTVSNRQDKLVTYNQNIPRRRKTSRQNIPTEQTEAYTTRVPAKQGIAYTNIPPRRNRLPSTPQYEQDAIPPTVAVEQNQGYDTIVQPTYVPKAQESVKQEDTSTNAASQENNEYKEYVGEDTYNDYNENNNNDNNYNNEDQEDDNNSHDEKPKEHKKNKDGHYSFSHIERYEEPLDDEEPTRRPTYKVREDNSDYSEYDQTTPVLQRGAYRRLEPDYYDQDRVQYIDAPSTQRDPDYDQAQGQNVQLEKVETPHQAKGDHEDLVKEAGHHHKKHHKPKKEHSEGEAGDGAEHHEGKHHEHGEKGKKEYKEFHEHDESKKGHHDKEGHDHHYDEKKGHNKKHHDEAGYHAHHEKGEEGEKKHAFTEKGKHNKGHSTKGEHVIHKKDEFEKKTEFFDEFHEGGDMDKDGGYHVEHHHKKGGHHKKGHHHEGHEEKKQGEKGKHEKGHHQHEKKGHDVHEGHDHHHHHEEKHGKKGAHEDAKHWHHKKG